MYLDTFLFITGIVCALLSATFIVYLIISNRRSKVYRTILKQETEFFDALSTTVSLSNITDQSKVQKSNDLDRLNRDLSFTQVLIKSDLPQQAKDNAEYLTNMLIDGEKRVIDDEPKIDFDATALEGRYILEREIYGGGMSRVFVARHAKLENQWIIKFIAKDQGELASEVDILKKLNHINLPKIIDIFQDDKGIYIVESYVEGVSLDKVLETGQKVNEIIINEWALQLAQVLSYLHNMRPNPILHLDMKPSNIMVTHDNKLVLIDFGISKRDGEDSTKLKAVTYTYAAPEQLKHRIPEKFHSLIESRFGDLPSGRIKWHPDVRTDIYSLGLILFELAVGQVKTINNEKTIIETVSNDLSKIIQKCSMINPDERYQTAKELMLDLQKTKGTKVKMARTLFLRKFAVTTSAFSLLISGGSLISAAQIYEQERLSALLIKPEIVIVSLQQSTDLKVEKKTPSGNIVTMDTSKITWEFSPDNVAVIDGNRIVGMNEGQTELYGQYREKTIILNVNVVKPMEGIVDISQRYQLGHTAEVFAGGKNRGSIDGAMKEADFLSPESIAVSANGTIYVSDSGVLREIKNGEVGTIDFEPTYLTPKTIRCYQNDLYVLTNAWQDAEDNTYYYGIIKLTDEGAEGLYISDAQFTSIEDFAFAPNGLLYFIDRNEGAGITYLKTLNTKDTEEVKTLIDLPKGTCSLTIDEQGFVYLSNPTTGVIQTFKDGALSYFAGVVNEKAFIDGAVPNFYEPQRIKYANNYLFVWDFNTLRRISIQDGVVTDTITLAGEASPTFDLEISTEKYEAEKIILPNSKLMDFVVVENKVLLTDAKRGAIWIIE